MRNKTQRNILEKNDKNRLLASLAVFGVLQNDNKSISKTLLEFLVEIIKTERLYSFTAAQITANLKEYYGFDILDAVISKILKDSKLFRLTNSNFYVDDESLLKGFDLAQKETEQTRLSKKFFYDLNKYIEKEKKRNPYNLGFNYFHFLINIVRCTTTHNDYKINMCSCRLSRNKRFAIGLCKKYR